MNTLLRPSHSVPLLSDTALLIARVAVGFVLLAHGWQKYNDYTIDGTAAAFGDMGVPAPAVAAVFTTLVEIIGGLALIAGLLTPVAALLNIANLFGALVLVHASRGVFVENGGYELVVSLIAGLTIIAAVGAGRFGVDGLLARRARLP